MLFSKTVQNSKKNISINILISQKCFILTCICSQGVKSLTEEVFQIDSGQMALTANDKTTERALANHSPATKCQFETPSDCSHQQTTDELILDEKLYEPFQ